MVTGQGYGCVLWPTGHSSITLFSLSVSIKDRSLHKASWARHRFIVPSAYLGMGAGKTCYSLVMGSCSFRTDCYGGFGVKVLAPHYVRDLGTSAWSPSLDRDLDPRTGG